MNRTGDPDGPLRIAYLTYRGKPHVGGQGVYTRHLTKALVDLGHHVAAVDQLALGLDPGSWFERGLVRGHAGSAREEQEGGDGFHRQDSIRERVSSRRRCTSDFHRGRSA